MNILVKKSFSSNNDANKVVAASTSMPTNLPKVIIAFVLPSLILYVSISISLMDDVKPYFVSLFSNEIGIVLLIILSILFLLGITLLGEWAAAYKALSNRAPIDLQSLKQGLLSITNSSLPVEIEQVGDSKLKIRWKYTDQRFVHLFGAGIVRGGYELLIKLSPRNHTVYASETITKLNISAGGLITQSATVNFHFFKGIILFTFNYAQSKGFKIQDGNLQFGQLYQYTFNPDELKGPIITYINANGWNYNPKVFLI